jgi:hypothetical protein
MFSKQHRARAVREMESAAQEHRLAQARMIIALFEVVNGRPARTMEELERWTASAPGRELMAQHRDADGKIEAMHLNAR